MPGRAPRSVCFNTKLRLQDTQKGSICSGATTCFAELWTIEQPPPTPPPPPPPHCPQLQRRCTLQRLSVWSLITITWNAEQRPSAKTPPRWSSAIPRRDCRQLKIVSAPRIYDGREIRFVFQPPSPPPPSPPPSPPPPNPVLMIAKCSNNEYGGGRGEGRSVAGVVSLADSRIGRWRQRDQIGSGESGARETLSSLRPGVDSAKGRRKRMHRASRTLIGDYQRFGYQTRARTAKKPDPAWLKFHNIDRTHIYISIYRYRIRPN